jgi:nucleotide-binding universal stress UspA family protein
MGATLHVVHAKSAKTRLTVHPGDAFPVPEDDIQPYIEKVANRLAQKGVLALPDVRQRQPAEEILAAARETGAGLICLATHGRTGRARELLGSVAESVFRNAPCPVLLRRIVATTARREQEHATK